ncbi:MAG: co-chaperone GroES [Candidatus Shikimatogenerans bostrichidophilus]|nr:MAG: co-chaperone GroES [Candidatus Shikimatogenerans bostrichidophilus]
MVKLNIKPLNDRVLVEPIPVDNKTSTGIIIPETAKDKPQKGIVLAVGDGKNKYKMTVKVGDKILYSKYSGTEININNKEYLIMHESDILAIINN